MVMNKNYKTRNYKMKKILIVIGDYYKDITKGFLNSAKLKKIQRTLS